MNDSSISEMLDQLRDSFLEDLPARIDLIEDEVMASKDNDSYDELFRMVHSLKGSAGSYNFHVITKIAHDMEDVMLALMQRDVFGLPETIKFLLNFIDVLRDTTLLLIESNTTPQNIDERLNALRAEIFKDSINVLVVEPSKAYASLIEYSLQDMSVNFTFKQDGLTALDNLLLNKYDFLITSLECPRLNGDALVAALRLGSKVNRNIKVVLVSAGAESKVKNKGDFDAILNRKSIKDGLLSSTIAKLLV